MSKIIRAQLGNDFRVKNPSFSLEDVQITLDSQQDVLYLTTKDETVKKNSTAGFRLRIEKGSQEDRTLRAVLLSLLTEQMSQQYQEAQERYEENTSDRTVIEDDEKITTHIHGSDYGGTLTQYKDGHHPQTYNAPEETELNKSFSSNTSSVLCETSQKAQKTQPQDFRGYTQNKIPLGSAPREDLSTVNWNSDHHNHLVISPSKSYGGFTSSHNAEIISSFIEYFTVKEIEFKVGDDDFTTAYHQLTQIVSARENAYYSKVTETFSPFYFIMPSVMKSNIKDFIDGFFDVNIFVKVNIKIIYIVKGSLDSSIENSLTSLPVAQLLISKMLEDGTSRYGYFCAGGGKKRIPPTSCVLFSFSNYAETIVDKTSASLTSKSNEKL